MQVGPTTTFSQIHDQLKPGLLDHGAKKHLRFEGGTRLYTHNSLVKSRSGQAAALDRASKQAAGAAQVKQAIDHQYGPGYGDKIFRQVNAQHHRNLDQSVSRGDLNLLKTAIGRDQAQIQAQMEATHQAHGRQLLDGADSLMSRLAPNWCKSNIASDGLPAVQSSTDSGGRPLHHGETGVENDYAKWMRGTIADLPRGAYMNCWQAVLASAVEGGLITKTDLQAMYATAARSDNKLVGLLNQLGYDRAADVDWRATPPRPGDIIVIDKVDGSGRDHAFHVMIAGEDDMVYSHDKSDLARWSGYGKEPSADCMVHRDREPVMTYAENAIAGQDGEMRVRYCRALLE